MRFSNHQIDWPLVSFFALAYAIAWSLVPVLAIVASNSGVDSWVTLNQMVESWDYQDVEPTIPKWVLYLLTRIQDFSFSIAGITLIVFTAGRQGLIKLGQRLLQWRIGWLWFFLALSPLGLYFVATVAAGALDSFQFNSSTGFKILVSVESGILVTLFLRGPFGEELGLRGFALPRLLTKVSAFRASFIIGLLWALWHLPVLFTQDLLSIIVFLLLALLLSFVFTWLFINTNGSLIPVLLFHTTQNNEETFEVLFPSLLLSDWELVSSLALLVIGIAIAISLYRTSPSQGKP